MRSKYRDTEIGSLSQPTNAALPHSPARESDSGSSVSVASSRTSSKRREALVNFRRAQLEARQVAERAKEDLERRRRDAEEESERLNVKPIVS